MLGPSTTEHENGGSAVPLGKGDAAPFAEEGPTTCLTETHPVAPRPPSLRATPPREGHFLGSHPCRFAAPRSMKITSPLGQDLDKGDFRGGLEELQIDSLLLQE